MSILVYRVQSSVDFKGPFSKRFRKVTTSGAGKRCMEVEIPTFIPGIQWQEQDHQSPIFFPPQWTDDYLRSLGDIVRLKRAAPGVKRHGWGCLDPEHLKVWFTRSEMVKLKQHGFHCVVIEAHEILVDINDSAHAPQCMFTSTQALNEYVKEFELYE